MALPGVHQPIRSISLPSRIHPPSVKLKHWQAPSFSTNSDSFGAETVHLGLKNLAELCNCVHELIQPPLASHTLLRHQNGKLVEDALDGSVTLQDTCDAARNILLTMKEHIQNLQSAFRRKGRLDLIVNRHVNAYFAFRKKAKKEISKYIVGLKKLESKNGFLMRAVNADHHLDTMVRVLRKATRTSISIFRSLFLYISTLPAIKTKACGFSMLSELILLRSSTLSGQKPVNEMQSVDFVLNSIHDEDSRIQVQMAKEMLESLENSFRCLETGLDSMFKCLVQNRVLFLNIFTGYC